MAERPLVSEWQSDADGSHTGTVVFDPTADAVLYDHVYKGTPLLPAAAILEIFAEAAERAGLAPSAVTMERVEFTNGIRCFTPAPQTLHMRMNAAEGGFTARLTQEFRNRTGALLDAARLCTACHLPAKPPPFDDWGWQAPPASGWQTVIYSESEGNRMGPSLHGLQRLLLQADTGWGEILARDESPWKAARKFPWRFSPGVLDAALVACNLWVSTNRPGALQIPQHIRRIWIGDNPPAGTKLEETFHVQQVTDTSAAYDIRVRTPDGRIVLKIDDYICALLREPSNNPISLSAPA